MPKITDIVGHQVQLKQLQDDLGHENVSHAYLFAGNDHLGKMTVARRFASQLLSQGVEPDELEKVQNQIEKLVHPDLLVLDQLWIEDICEDWDVIAKTSNVSQQHRAKKPPAKTNIISIDDIRVLQDRLYETGTGTWRCCIIRSVERMQDAAANAFLKILEEPPAGLVFLLTTQSTSALLPTIVSRTRVMTFHTPPHEQLLPLLTDFSEDDAQFILHLAQGAPGTIITLRDNSDLLRAERLMHSKALSFWRSQSLRERVQLLSPLHKRGEESDQFIMHLAMALREQAPTRPLPATRALTELIEGLNTNAHRQLIAQRFALAITR